MGRDGHADDREGHEPARERHNAHQIVGELAPGRRPRRGIQERRQHHVEHHVRVEFDGGRARHQTQGEAGDDEDDGIRRVKSPRQQRKHDHEEQEDEEDSARGLYTGGHAPTSSLTHSS